MELKSLRATTASRKANCDSYQMNVSQFFHLRMLHAKMLCLVYVVAFYDFNVAKAWGKFSLKTHLKPCMTLILIIITRIIGKLLLSDHQKLDALSELAEFLH